MYYNVKFVYRKYTKGHMIYHLMMAEARRATQTKWHVGQYGRVAMSKNWKYGRDRQKFGEKSLFPLEGREQS